MLNRSVTHFKLLLDYTIPTRCIYTLYAVHFLHQFQEAAHGRRDMFIPVITARHCHILRIQIGVKLPDPSGGDSVK